MFLLCCKKNYINNGINATSAEDKLKDCVREFYCSSRRVNYGNGNDDADYDQDDSNTFATQSNQARKDIFL